MGHSVPYSYGTVHPFAQSVKLCGSGMGCREAWKRDHPRQFREGVKKTRSSAFSLEKGKRKEGEEREKERKNSLKELSHFLFFPSSVLLEHLRTPQKKGMVTG